MWGYQKFYSIPPKKWIWAQNWQFWPIIGIFDWSNGWPKSNGNKLHRCFFCYGYQKFYILPQKLGFLAHKRPNLAQNWLFWPNISIFGPFDLMPDQKTMRTSCRSGFQLCWYQNFYLLPKKLGFLAQKRPNLAQNWLFWPNISRIADFGQFWPKCAFRREIYNFAGKLLKLSGIDQ